MKGTAVTGEPFSWLKQTAPEFYMNGENIKIIIEPNEFFSILNNQIRNASKRITLSSLYLGTGHLEQQLVSSMDEALMNSDCDLRIKILLDFTRGSRGDENSRTMLLPLLNRLETKLERDDRDSRVQVALYHTPDLRGLLKRFVPDRWNEVIGLSHMKIYVVDDNVIISGANLSNDYFTNRQDRYVLFRDRILADFFDELVSTVSLFSLHLQPDNSLRLSNNWNIHPHDGDGLKFKHEARRRVEELVERWKEQTQSNPLSSNGDSKVYPLIQMGPLGITQDSDSTERILKTASSFSTIRLASGYFNLTGRYQDLILNKSAADFKILTAAPKANGFFGAKGIPGSIPKVYTFISSLFYDKILAQKQESRISIFEYERPQWTFHAKGLWYYLPSDAEPTMTLIGSPNFGHRSVYRDLESQVAIVTENRQLQRQLHSEQKRLLSVASQVTSGTFSSPDRHVPLWVRLFARVFKNFF